MRVLEADFSARTEDDLIPLDSSVVKGDLRSLRPGERVLLKDRDLKVIGQVVLKRSNYAPYAKIDWKTVVFF